MFEIVAIPILAIVSIAGWFRASIWRKRLHVCWITALLNERGELSTLELRDAIEQTYDSKFGIARLYILLDNGVKLGHFDFRKCYRNTYARGGHPRKYYRIHTAALAASESPND